MKRIAIYLPFIVLSFVVGCSIPAYYEWSGADQSRSPPVLAYTALGMLACACGLWLALPWLPISTEPSKTNYKWRLRFNLRGLLILTSAIALLIAATMKFPLLASGALYLVVIVCMLKLAIDVVEVRWQTAALLAAHYLPFAWIATASIGVNVSLVMLASSLGLPNLLATLLFGSWARINAQSLGWLALLLTSLSLAVGAFLIRLGPRLTIAYLVFVLLSSTFSSFILNALVRM